MPIPQKLEMALSEGDGHIYGATIGGGNLAEYQKRGSVRKIRYVTVPYTVDTIR